MARSRQPRPQFPSSGTTIPNDDVEMVGANDLSQNKDRLDEGYHSTNGVPTPDTLEPDAAAAEDAGLQVVGKNVKELFETINQLGQLGVENLQIPLPKIVVVGDQSAGKSSLIEAISGIKVPRASGTCTRCPLQINLTPNEEEGAPWICQVTLHKTHDYYKHLTPEEFEDQLPHANPSFWPWAPKDAPEDTPFRLVRNRDEIEETLKRAQTATLNPQANPAMFASGKDPNPTMEASFSPNIVRLDISGPNLPNLSFYDLPGVINQTEIAQDTPFVKVVRKLVKQYIEQENALVLLCCSMEGDMANSTASGLVRGLEAERRTMGVLTKPDRAPQFGPEQFNRLKTVLDGDHFEVAHGYYVTKQPSQTDLDNGIDHSTARQAERAYFKNEEPWKTKLAQFKNNFGTDCIQSNLSELLAEQILLNLPRISKQVQTKIASLDQELAAMPDPPSDDSVRIVYEILHKCNDEIRKNMVGARPHHDFKLEWKGLVEKFSQALFSMRPTLVVRSNEESQQSIATSSQSSVSPSVSRDYSTINLDSDDETPSSRTGRKRQQPEPVTPSKRQRTTPLPTRPMKRSEFAKRFTLDSIRQTIDEANTSGVPGQVDPKAVDYLICTTVEHWDKPVDEFVRQTEQVLRDTIHETLNRYTREWTATELVKSMKSSTNEFLATAFKNIRTTANRLVKLEKSKPWTFNEESLNSYRLKELAIFCEARQRDRASLFLDELEARTGKSTVGDERAKKLKQITPEQLKEDPFATEIQVMSRVRGYYTVASLRLLDHLAQVMLVELFDTCKESLYNQLQRDLGVNARDAMDRCQRLLAEDPEREALRIRKKKERARLVEAQGKLNALHAL